MKICFLDRDGVIIKDINYLIKIKDIKFTKGIFEGLKKVQALKYKIFIITNQSGVARGYLKENKLKKIHKFIINSFFKKKILINGIYYCPHHPGARIKKYKKDCNMRKPKPGMILKILRKNNKISRKDCFLVGDKMSDIKTGKNAGLKRNFLFSYNKNFDNFIKNLIKYKKI